MGETIVGSRVISDTSQVIVSEAVVEVVSENKLVVTKANESNVPKVTIL